MQNVVHNTKMLTCSAKFKIFSNVYSIRSSPILNGRSWISWRTNSNHEDHKEEEKCGQRKAHTIHGQVSNKHVTVNKWIMYSHNRYSNSTTQPRNLQITYHRTHECPIQSDSHSDLSLFLSITTKNFKAKTVTAVLPTLILILCSFSSRVLVKDFVHFFIIRDGHRRIAGAPPSCWRSRKFLGSRKF